MANLSASIKWATNAVDQAKKMAEFTDSIVAVTASADKMAATLSGAKLIQSANNLAAAIDKVGGTSKLTAAEQERWLPLLDKAIAKYEALGQKAPTAMVDMAKSMRKTADDAEGMKAKFESLGPQILKNATAFATGLVSVEALSRGFGMLKDFVGDAVSSFLGAEAAAAKVDAALRSSGQYTPQLSRQYSDLASEIEAMTVNSDDANSEAIALFTTIGQVGPDKMRAAMIAAANLSAGLGKDLNSSVEVLSKAAMGNVGALEKFGIQVDKTADSGKQLDLVLAAVNARFGGQAESQIHTTAGQLAQLANAWDNVKEAVGGMIVQSPAFQASLNAVNYILKQQADDADRAADAYNRYLAAAMQRGLKLPTNAMTGKDINLSAPIAEVRDYVAALAAAKQEVDKLTDSQRAQLDAGLAMGRDQDELAKAAKISTEALKLYQPATKSAAKDTKDAAREAKELADGMSKLAGVAEEVRYAHERYNATVEETTGIVLATLALREKYQKNLPLPGLQKEVELTRSLGSVLDEIAPDWRLLGTYQPFSTQQQQAMSNMISNLGIVRGLVDDVGRNMTGSGRAITAAFSAGIGIVQTYIGALRDAKSAAEATAAASAFASGAMTLVFSSWISGIAANFANFAKLKAEVIDLRGEIQKLGATPVTIDYGFSGQVGRSAPVGLNKERDALKKQLEDLQKVQDDLNASMGRYSLSSDQMGTATQQLARRVAQTVTDFERLSKAGFSMGTIVAGAAGNLNSLLMTALTTGQKLPASLQPYLEQLIRSGQLTDDVRNKMLGISPVPWQEAQAAAEAWGISVDKLGLAFQQAKLSEEGEKVAAQFEAMKKVGTDVNTIMSSMSSEMTTSINDMIGKALKLGLTIPESMKPLLQAMVDAGKLTDENGEKLGDLSRVQFAKDLNSQIEDLIGKMGELIDKFSDAAAAAAGIGGVQAPDVPSQAKKQPNRAHGGAFVAASGIQKLHEGAANVARILQFPSLGSDEVPAILQAGEAVLQRRAVAALGRGRVAQLNRGIDGGSGGGRVVTQATTVHVHPTPGMNERELAAQVVKGLGRGAALSELKRLVNG